MKQFYLVRLSQTVAMAVLVFCSATTVAAPQYSAVYAFGDSLSDNGNIANITEAAGQSLHPLYFDSFPSLMPTTAYEVSRKMTNSGPVWVESLAAGLGLPALPSTTGGTIYATAGANSTDNLPYVPPEHEAVLSIEEQTQLFLAQHGGAAPSDALYAFSEGGNDLLDAVTYATSPQQIGEITAASLQSFIGSVTALALAGAHDILVVNVPNLGLTPQSQLMDNLMPGFADNLTLMSAAYNEALDISLSTLDQQLAAIGVDVNVMLLDSFGLITDVVNDPQAYGFTEANQACLGFAPQQPCANPDEYVFWDGAHPTVALHNLAAAGALSLLDTEGEVGVGSANVPLVPTLMLMFGGLTGWSLSKRGREVRNA